MALVKRARRISTKRRNQSQMEFLKSRVYQLTRNVNYLRMITRPEKKRLYWAVSDTKVHNTHMFTHVNALSQGDANDEREGNEVFGLYLYIKGTLLYNGGSDVVRIGVLFDTDPEGSAPTALEIFRTDVENDLVNIENTHRFKMLKLKTFTVDNVGSNWRQFRWYFRLNLPSRYELGVAGTIADMNYGSLYVFYCAKNNDFTYIDFVSQFCYIDN